MGLGQSRAEMEQGASPRHTVPEPFILLKKPAMAMSWSLQLEQVIQSESRG